MRALCGAIIVVGALIGMGLTAMAIGNRYHTTVGTIGANNEPVPLHLYELDRPLIYVLGFMTITAVIGLGITFFGLAYHHRRRHHEFLREHGEVIVPAKRAKT